MRADLHGQKDAYIHPYVPIRHEQTEPLNRAAAQGTGNRRKPTNEINPALKRH